MIAPLDKVSLSKELSAWRLSEPSLFEDLEGSNGKSTINGYDSIGDRMFVIDQ
jgi:hypothetical protein